jgi:two-component SAPR family response regulator
LARAARRRNPDLKVIYMSGYSAGAVDRDGILDTDTVLLNKPFRRQQLALALRETLEG